jgi:multiple sugar transport system permease protein
MALGRVAGRRAASSTGAVGVARISRDRFAPARKVLAILALGVVGVVYFFPLYWLVATALKGRAELYAPVPSLFPAQPTLEAFESVLFERDFVGLLRNSIIACGTSTFFALCIAFAITYPITRLNVSRRLRANVLNWALSLRFLPPVAVVVPYFSIVRWLGIYNQLPALILVYTVFSLPFAIWMLKGFLVEIPQEIEEAAYVDGANRWAAFRTVLLPLAAPGILAAGIIIFAFTWSEFLFALILTATPQAMTFPVGVQGLVTQFEIIWNDMAAAGVIAIVVPLTLMLIARRYVMAGLTFGVIREK